MHLVFSSTDHMNTDISDEQGHTLYTVSTPLDIKQVTTIIKYRWSGRSGIPETMGIIEWHRSRETLFRFNGKVIEANAMLEKRRWKAGRYFVGPDGRSYKWKTEPTYCWLKPAGLDVELVKFHEKNLGIMKESHPPYLDVSSKVASMLDHVVLTYVYVESLRQDQSGGPRHRNRMSMVTRRRRVQVQQG